MQDNVSTILILPILIGLPVLIIWLEDRSSIVRWISPIIICYLAGILLGNLPFFSFNHQTLGVSHQFLFYLQSHYSFSR